MTTLACLYATGDDVETAIRQLYADVDELLVAEAFGACDDLLARADVARMEVEVALAVLIVTLGARARLPSRATFFDRVQTRAQAQGLLDASPNLLEGLA